MTLAGFVPVNKPGTCTSHDVVRRIRRLLPGRARVGHCGTLDPSAQGVLLVAIGVATRLVEYQVKCDKEYRARIRLGVETDTYDMAGTILREHPVPPLTDAQVRVALEAFTGEVGQVPPMVSAIKRGGEPLYKKARRGETVAVPARPVRIDRLELTGREGNDLLVTITCGPGTYIRSLAHDLGKKLGCGGTVAALTRTRSGEFTVANAVPLAELEANGPEPYVVPLEQVLNDIPRVTLAPEEAKRIRHGNVVALAKAAYAGMTVRLFAGDRLLAIGQSDGALLKPVKVLNVEQA